MPKLSNGARGFNTLKEKDASPRLIAIGGGWGGGGDEDEPKLKRKTAQGYYILGEKYLELIRFSEAIAALEKAVKLNPNYYAAYDALGEAYAYSGASHDFEDKDDPSKFEQMRFGQAIRAYEQARRLAPKTAYIHINLGILYFNTSQYQKAADSFKRGLNLKPKPYDLSYIIDEGSLADEYFNLGEAYEYLGQNENAIKYYQQALIFALKEEKQSSPLSDIYWKLGQAYEKVGQLDKALTFYQKFLDGEGYLMEFVDYCAVYLSIGRFYVDMQKYNEAAIAFGRAVDIHCDPQASYNLGVTQLSLNQTEKAIESFKRVIELDEKNVDARFNIGVAYLTLGNKEAAREQVRLLKAVDAELAIELEELIDR